MTNKFSDDAIIIGEPEQITAGMYTRWTVIGLAALYPESDYNTYYVFRTRGTGMPEVNLPEVDSATASYLKNDMKGGGDCHRIYGAVIGDRYVYTVSNKDYEFLKSGSYFWQLHALRLSDRETIELDHGEMIVKPNLTDARADPRSHAEIMIDKINSILENRADGDVSNYSIGGRSLVKLSIKELLIWRDYYLKEIRAGKVSASDGKVIRVQFR